MAGQNYQDQQARLLWWYQWRKIRLVTLDNILVKSFRETHNKKGGNLCQNFEITIVFEKYKSKWADLIKEEVQEEEEATEPPITQETTGTINTATNQTAEEVWEIMCIHLANKQLIMT